MKQPPGQTEGEFQFPAYGWISDLQMEARRQISEDA